MKAQIPFCQPYAMTMKTELRDEAQAMALINLA
jgi:hypothetical protein